MADPITVTISVLALAISATTAWLTLFRRGTVKMTQPTVIIFGLMPKVYLRTLLFATSKRGRVIESMHVSLKGGNRFWAPIGASKQLMIQNVPAPFDNPRQSR